MGKLVAMRGNEAVAYATKYARVEIVAAYPITPQTIIVEKIDELISKGEMNAEMIHVESEHSALAATYGAAVGGVRAFTATSSHGLMYMYEMLWWAAGSRVPIVMAVVTRAMGPPWNIHVSHEDILATRDTGWLVSMAENNQEAFDLTVMMFRVTEDPRVYLPGIVGLDGFILSHTVEPVELPEQEQVDEFLPPRRQPYTMEPGKPISMGNLFPDEVFEEMRMDMQRSILEAKKVIVEVGREYGKIFGRYYDKMIECYRCSDADYLIVGIGPWMGDAKIAADILREKGIRAGVARLRWIRPFPWEELREIGMSKKAVIVFDRSISPGGAGPLFLEVSSALEAKPSMVGVVAGVGGVDISYEDIAQAVEKIAAEVEEKGRVYKPTVWYHLGKMYPLTHGEEVLPKIEPSVRW
jgi:2-oxoisovalerate ferredoxin oxidoreductase alpha subunit